MENWNALRTARRLVELGTLSATAKDLGIHRATVMRHVDALEETLGEKLFQRHARGYTPTEVGYDLLHVVASTDALLREFVDRTRGRAMSVSGELVVTSMEIVSHLVFPLLKTYRDRYPESTVRYEASDRLFRLEYGDAHIAIRTGQKPEDPDSIVRPFGTMQSALYAHPLYVAVHGLPTSCEELAQHAFVSDGGSESRDIAARWLLDLVPEARVVFHGSNARVNFSALRAGLGLGFCPTVLAQQFGDLVEVCAPQPAWDVPLWFMVHMDLYRNSKVQAFLQVFDQMRSNAVS